MPDLIRAFAQRDPLRLVPARGIEDAQLHFLGVGGEEREVDTLSVPGGSTRIGLAGPDGAYPLPLLRKRSRASAGQWLVQGALPYAQSVSRSRLWRGMRVQSGRFPSS